MMCIKLNVKNKPEVKNMIDDLVEKETFTKNRNFSIEQSKVKKRLLKRNENSSTENIICS